MSFGIFEQQDKAFCSVYSNLLLISCVNQLIKVNYIIIHKIQWLTGMYSQINTLASFLPHAAPQGEFLSSAFKLWLNTIDLEHVVIQMIIRTGLQVRLRSVWTSGWEFLKDNASSRTSEPLQAVVHYTNYLINSITPMRGSSLATKPGRKYRSGKNDTEMECFYHFHLLVKCMEQHQVNTDTYNKQFSSKSTVRFVWKRFQVSSIKKEEKKLQWLITKFICMR